MTLEGLTTAELIVNWKKAGELYLQLKADALPRVQFKLTYDVDKAKMVLGYNDQDLEVSIARQGTLGFSFEAKHNSGNFVKALFDDSARIVKFDSKIVGKEVKLDAQYSATMIKVEVIEPFTNARKHTLEASFKQT